MSKASRPPSSILHPRCIFLAGPTAVGKSEIALLLAEKIGGEIISVDSMQVYRGLDLGTAKPSAAERARVRHHLIDVVDLTESFDAAQFVRLANAAVADDTLRAELEAMPLPQLLAELAEKDPVTYERIDRKNPRRVVRAVEVIRLTGKKFSEQRAEWQTTLGAPASRRRVARLAAETPPLPGITRLIGLSRPNPDLHARINTRVDAMFARGLVEETRRLLEHGLAQNKTAMQALGYRQVVEHLRGERPLPETIDLVKSKTRQFAKRQMTWFRRQLNLQWIELEGEQELLSIAARISDSQ